MGTIRRRPAPIRLGPNDDARSKLAAVVSLFGVARQADLEVAVLRPPLVYGPGIRANVLSLMMGGCWGCH